MSTTALSTTLADRYIIGLTEYLRGAGEKALEQAYELGRTAVGNGLGVLDIARMFQEAIASLLPTMTSPAETDKIVTRATLFLGESLSAFEMTHRGFRETISS